VISYVQLRFLNGRCRAPFKVRLGDLDASDDQAYQTLGGYFMLRWIGDEYPYSELGMCNYKRLSVEVDRDGPGLFLELSEVGELKEVD
jgi:hypothetical protein